MSIGVVNPNCRKCGRALVDQSDLWAGRCNNDAACAQRATAADVCGKQCAHGSECLLLAGHVPADRHETQHECVFYDTNSRDASATFCIEESE